MRESYFWKIVKKNLGEYFAGSFGLVRVENAVFPGMPDVHYFSNFSSGWIELKSIKEWPKRKSTVVRLPHLTQEQRLWQRMRKDSYILCSVGKSEVFLFQHGKEYFDINDLGTDMIKQDWYEQSIYSGPMHKKDFWQKIGHALQ